PHHGGGLSLSADIAPPPPRWGRAGVGVMQRGAPVDRPFPLLVATVLARLCCTWMSCCWEVALEEIEADVRKAPRGWYGDVGMKSYTEDDRVLIIKNRLYLYDFVSISSDNWV